MGPCSSFSGRAAPAGTIHAAPTGTVQAAEGLNGTHCAQRQWPGVPGWHFSADFLQLASSHETTA